MKTNKKQTDEINNVSEKARENTDQKAAPRAWQKGLKATAVTSAVSLALLGATQIPVQALLGGAEPPVHAQTRAGNQDERALNEFFRRNFNYVDAKVLANYWGEKEKVYEAKVRMGYLLLGLNEKDAMRYVREARGVALESSSVTSAQGYAFINFPIDYTDGGYQYEDAEALSKYWKQDISETKLLMETMLVSGKDREIQTALKNAKSERR